MKNKSLMAGSLGPIILKLLRENGRMYGYQITQEVLELTEGELIIKEGSLYPTLHRLEAQGLLTHEYVEVSNRMRKYYRLTPEGETEAVSSLEEIHRFLHHLGVILKPKPD